MQPIIQQAYKKTREGVLSHLFSLDGIILVLLPIISIAISFLIQPSFFVSTLLFLGLPAIFISIRFPRYILKTAVFSLTASIPLMVILEYFGGLSLSWAFPPSVFDFHILHKVSIEVLVWAFLNIFAVTLFYETMFDRHQRISVWNKKMWILVRYLLVWIALFTLVLLITKEVVYIPYFYLLFGLILFLYPIIMTWLYYPTILRKVAYTTIYFSFLSLLYEITALKLGWWYFPGTNFIGYVILFNTTFPIEELLFWIILFAPAVTCAFEYLDDDHR